MSDHDSRRDPVLGLPPRADGLPPDLQRLGLIDRIAALASLVWLGAAGAFMWFGADGAGGVPASLLWLMVLVLPVVAIWLGAAVLRSARIMRAEAERMEIALESLRQAILAERHGRGAKPAATPAVTRGPQLPPRAATVAGDAAAVPDAPEADPAPAPRPVPAAVIRPLDGQASLAFGPVEPEPPPLEAADLIRALNFPESDSDHDGFVALRRALRDRKTRQLIQAAQDVLTLLSQDGIYTDDLRPDRARPEMWRRFASGERGRAVAQLGGIRDRSCLAVTMQRMREDTVFRDTAHHFLRLFDRMLADFEPGASDEALAALSETRTARAFMLIGRVTGAFD